MYPLAEGLFAPRNQWYIAAWSKEVTRTPMERYLLDEPVALYRKEDGTAVAVEGRCPPRSFPLGNSRVVGDDIQCGYHGITFRPDGSCAKIPSQKAIPNVCRIKAYPLVEKWKWLWIWMGDPALADESLIPDHHEIGLTDPAIRCAGDVYHHVPGRYMLMHDNLFDLTHIGYLHLDSFGADSALDAVPKLSEGPNWVESKYSVSDVDCPPFYQFLLQYQGRINRTVGLRLYMPSLHAGADNFYRVNPDGSDGELIGSFRVFHGVTPETKTTTHYFVAAGHDWEVEDPDFIDNIVLGMDAGLQEDISATRYIEKMIQTYGGRPPELLLRQDNVCVHGRRFFERTIRAECAGQPPAAGRTGVALEVTE